MKTYLLALYIAVSLLSFGYSSNAASCDKQKSDLYSCLAKCNGNISLTCLQTNCMDVANAYSVCKNNKKITLSSAISHMTCLRNGFDSAVQCSKTNRCANITCVEEKCDSKIDAVFDCFA